MRYGMKYSNKRTQESKGTRETYSKLDKENYLNGRIKGKKK